MLNQAELKVVSRIMEVIDGQSRQLSLVSSEIPSISPKMIELIEKTYSEQGIPVSGHQIQSAVEIVKKSQAPAQGVDYLLSRGVKSQNRFSLRSLINNNWTDLKLHKQQGVIRYLMNFGLNCRPYSDQQRADFLKARWLAEQFKSRLFLGIGLSGLLLSLVGVASMVINLGFLSVGAVGSLCMVAFGVHHWWKKNGWKKMWSEVEKGNVAAIEQFHNQHVFDFTSWVAPSNPSIQSMNTFFGGLYVPSSPMVWNHQSKAIIEEIHANENVRKVMELWQEEGVAWRQQDFWFFVVLGYHTNALPDRSWLSL